MPPYLLYIDFLPLKLHRFKKVTEAKEAYIFHKLLDS